MSGGGSQVMTSTQSTINIHTNTNNEAAGFSMPEASQPQSQTASQIHNMRLSYQQHQHQHQQGGINVNNSTGIGDHDHPHPSLPFKKKRGRPRKYAPDGSMPLQPLAAPPSSAPASHLMPLSAPGPHQSQSQPQPQPQPVQAVAPQQQHIAPPMGEVASPSTGKKRGRPLGSGKKQKHADAIGSGGFGFTPHIIAVKAGEDVSSKIMGFSQHGPRAVCILSANGSISNVTLRQLATSGGTVTYEGRFEILSLSGSYLPSEDGGQRSRTGGLSVSLSGPDGRVLGGSVAGLLVAATPVQVVVGSFIADGRKDLKPVNHIEPISATRITSTGGSTGGSSPQSRGALSESSGGPGSPLNQISSACNNNNNPQLISGISWK